MGPHDIGWAVAVIKGGGYVRRPQWAPGISVGQERLTAAGTNKSFLLTMIFIPSAGRSQPFTCHHDDLLATDWELA